MSISNLTVPNNFNLFANTFNVRDLIAEKIENRTGGAFIGPWSSEISYGEGDVVIYQGCLYSSLGNDNLNNIPNETSLFWGKISLIKSTKVYTVNSDTGDDTKAIRPCGGPYPFRTVDGALNQAVLDNPSGDFVIFLQKANNTYEMTQGISLPNVQILCGEKYNVNVNVSSEIEITSSGQVIFQNLIFRADRVSPDPTSMFKIRPNGGVKFFGCTFSYFVDGIINSTIPAIEYLPNQNFSASGLEFDRCTFVQIRLLTSDLVGEPMNSSILEIRDSIGIRIQETITNEPTSNTNNIMRLTDSEVFLLSCNKTNLEFTNTRLRSDTVINSNSPNFLTFTNCTMFDRFSKNTLFFRKLGTAQFYFTDFFRNNTLDIINPSALAGSFDRTSGPRYGYESANTYNINDLVVHNGALYKCLVNGTTGVTPDYGSANWDISNVNLLASIGTGADLSLLAATDSQLLLMGSEVSDPFNMVSIAANILTLRSIGTYRIELGITSATTSTAGQDSVFNIYIDKDTATPLYPGSDASTELTRGLVSNAVTFPSSNKIVILSIQTTSANESFGIYVRNTGAQAFDINLRNMTIERLL